MVRIVFQIAIVLAALAQFGVAVHEWRRIGQNTTEVRRTFWKSTMSGNQFFLNGILLLAMADVIPMSDVTRYWLSAAMAVSLYVVYQNQVHDWWKRIFLRAPSSTPHAPEKVPNI